MGDYKNSRASKASGVLNEGGYNYQGYVTYEEYAVSDFRSVCQRQVELVMIMPHKDSMRKG